MDRPRCRGRHRGLSWRHRRRRHWTVASPILSLWFAAPAIAWWISRPLRQRAARLTADQTVFLRELARKTWAFFETFVGPEDHWLPPDNFQEHPAPWSRIARRRPTWDSRCWRICPPTTSATFSPAADRAHGACPGHDGSPGTVPGHFYNWYDTQSLKPLPPLYVSTVDSGNLAGHLLTLRPGLLALRRCSDPRGAVLRRAAMTRSRRSTEVAAGAIADRLAARQRDLESAHDARPVTARGHCDVAGPAGGFREELAGASIPAPEPSATSEGEWWADALARQCQKRAGRADVSCARGSSCLPARNGSRPSPPRIPTLRDLQGLRRTCFLRCSARAVRT